MESSDHLESGANHAYAKFLEGTPARGRPGRCIAGRIRDRQTGHRRHRFAEKAAARGALIWDVRSAEDYRRGHITFDATAENVTYFNVGCVNGIIMQMQQRIDRFEGQIDELKAAKEKK